MSFEYLLSLFLILFYISLYSSILIVAHKIPKKLTTGSCKAIGARAAHHWLTLFPIPNSLRPATDTGTHRLPPPHLGSNSAVDGTQGCQWVRRRLDSTGGCFPLRLLPSPSGPPHSSQVFPEGHSFNKSHAPKAWSQALLLRNPTEHVCME